MRDDYKKINPVRNKSPKAIVIGTKRQGISNGVKGRLYGVGIGPGDPKLLTIKAKEILDGVGTIFVPRANDNEVSCALSIIETSVVGKKKYVELTFPMTKNKKILKLYWQKAASRIALEVRKNKDAAFVTIGDPFIYSTYIYLLKTLRRDFPDIETETIPGVSSFNAAAARAQLPLVEASEKFAVLAVKRNLEGLKDALEFFDTVVLMKVGSKLKNVIRLLKEMNLADNSLLVSRVGHREETIIRGLKFLKDKKLGYLSVIIVKRKRWD